MMLSFLIIDSPLSLLLFDLSLTLSLLFDKNLMLSFLVYHELFSSFDVLDTSKSSVLFASGSLLESHLFDMLKLILLILQCLDFVILFINSLLSCSLLGHYSLSGLLFFIGYLSSLLIFDGLLASFLFSNWGSFYSSIACYLALSSA